MFFNYINVKFSRYALLERDLSTECELVVVNT